MKPNNQTNKIRRKIVFFFMSFTLCFMQSCSTEDIEVSTASTVVGQLKNDLKLDQFAKKNFAENIVINWETINTIEKNGVTVYEVQISEIKQTTIESNLFQEELKYGLIAVKKGDEMHSYLIEAYSSVNYSLYANTIQNLGQFTGTLNVYELNGVLVGQLVVFNGKSTNPSSNNYLTPLDAAINLFYVSKSTTSRVPSCNITQFVHIINQHEVRHHVPTVIVGTYTNWGYSYSTFTLTTTGTYMSVPYPCGSDADYHHVPYMVTTHEDIYDDPCDIIKTQMANANCKAKIDELNTKTSLKKETGYSQSKNGPFTALSNSGSDSMSMLQDNTTIGYMHTHLDPYDSGFVDSDDNPIMNEPIRMFSPRDISTFIELLINAKKNNIPLSDVYGTMVSSKGTYTLKYEGVYSNLNLGLNFNDELDLKYKEVMEKNSSNKELGFLKFMKEHIGINGISLNKINKDGTTDKKTLNTNNKLVTTPCP